MARFPLSLLNDWLKLPRPRQRAALRLPRDAARILVVGKFPNPTFDYYFLARLAAPGMPPHECVDFRRFDPSTFDADNVYVIIVRYASKAVTDWIRKNRQTLAGVAVFVDDDMAGLVLGHEASIAYRYRLLSQSLFPLRRLDGVIDELWVSTPVLAERLRYAKPLVLPPAPEMEAGVAGPIGATSGSVTIAYHATAIHVEEHRFLVPVIRAVLSARAHARFEVVAEGRTAQLWLATGLDRLTICQPLPWPDYLRESRRRQIDIMIVPVAPGEVNDCRAETKRIDIARAGAAAVLSDCPAFRPSGEGEILLAYHPDLWTEQLIELVDDPRLRAETAAATRRQVEKMAARALVGIEPKRPDRPV